MDTDRQPEWFEDLLQELQAVEIMQSEKKVDNRNDRTVLSCEKFGKFWDDARKRCKKMSPDHHHEFIQTLAKEILLHFRKEVARVQQSREHGQLFHGTRSGRKSSVRTVNEVCVGSGWPDTFLVPAFLASQGRLELI